MYVRSLPGRGSWSAWIRCTGGSLIPRTRSTSFDSEGTSSAPAYESARFRHLGTEPRAHMSVFNVWEAAPPTRLYLHRQLTVVISEQRSDRVGSERCTAFPYSRWIFLPDTYSCKVSL